MYGIRGRVVLSGVWVMLIAACGPGDRSSDRAHAAEPPPDGREAVPIYDNLGDHEREISTASAQAEAYFNQGLRLEYAFNHAEAIRSYEAALGLDPDCAMCWWGIALASGPNINAPMDAEGGHRAFAAILEARRRTGEDLSGVEADLVDALAARYGEEPEIDRARLDSAYARALAGVAQRYPADPDVLTLYGASLMNLRPWDYWAGPYGDRSPNPGTDEIVRTLERAVELDPDNPGACHYYIHAVEAAFPERAVECADRLAALMPGAGHIVHMPGHIYIRVGRYADAVRQNEHAVHSDETYIADQNPMGLYPAAYYPHNYHFMAFAATMAGMSEKAREASRIVAPKIPKDVALAVYWLQNAVVFPHLTAVTFGRWDEVLELPLPDEDLYQATAMAWYARGVAHAARGAGALAEDALARVVQITQGADPGGENSILQIAQHALAGEIALRRGEPASAIDHFRVAADIEDGMLYEEPPLWYYPLRHSLGQALLAAGRPREAAAAYREDLARFPDNGWSLYGLASSLEALGQDASATWEAFRTAWADADVELTGSRF